MNSTSLTRRFARHLLAATLATALILPVVAQTPASARPRTQVSYVEIPHPQLGRVSRAIDLLTQQDKVGALPKEGQLELANLRSEYANLQDETRYQLNIEFPGGPLSDLLEAIKGPVSLNVISPGSTNLIKTVELPAFALRNANLLTLTKVVVNLVETQGYKVQIVDDSHHNRLIAMLSKPGGASAPTTSPAAFESIQLDGHLQSGLTVDTIVEAIRTAWELDPKNDREALKLKYHPPTKILLVSGPIQAIIVTKTVIGSIGRKPANATP